MQVATWPAGFNQSRFRLASVFLASEFCVKQEPKRERPWSHWPGISVVATFYHLNFKLRFAVVRVFFRLVPGSLYG